MATLEQIVLWGYYPRASQFLCFLTSLFICCHVVLQTPEDRNHLPFRPQLQVPPSLGPGPWLWYPGVIKHQLLLLNNRVCIGFDTTEWLRNILKWEAIGNSNSFLLHSVESKNIPCVYPCGGIKKAYHKKKIPFELFLLKDFNLTGLTWIKSNDPPNSKHSSCKYWLSIYSIIQASS